MPREYTKRDPIARFWSKVNKDGPTMPGMESPCWTWTGNRNPDGYGMTRWWPMGRRMHGAHRVAYAIAHGWPPGDLDVLHRCDNPPCVNEAHLFIGDHALNMADKERKGRANHAYGEAHGLSKLTAGAVVEMRRARDAGELFASIAKRHGVSAVAARLAILRKTWAHVA